MYIRRKIRARSAFYLRVKDIRERNTKIETQIKLRYKADGNIFKKRKKGNITRSPDVSNFSARIPMYSYLVL